MKGHLHELAMFMFSVCVKNCISIDIQWIPRKLNAQSDAISKFSITMIGECPSIFSNLLTGYLDLILLIALQILKISKLINLILNFTPLVLQV